MLEIRGRSGRLCDGLRRRSFLKLGGLGLGGLTLPELLRIRQAQAAPARRETSVILFWMAGGPSHIDTYDMKPTATDAIRGPFLPIATNLPGLEVCDLMPRHTEIADKLAVVRSLRHQHSVHDDASHWVQTGYPLLNARERKQQQPAQGAVVSALRGPNRPGLPAYVCIPEDYRTHLGFYQAATYLGAKHNALNAGGDPTLGKYRLPEFALPEGMSLERLQQRRELFGTMDRLVQHAESSGALQAMDQMQQQAFDLVTGARAREAFDLSREPQALRDKYGRHAFGQSALLARRMVEAGVTFVTINLYEKDVDWWDDHYTIEKNLRKRLPPYDCALATLIEDLHVRGLSEQVLVVACGEFGRAPRIDNNAGRGHWPRAMTAVLSGGGIKAGQIIGGTTADGGEPSQRPLGPGDLLASIYQTLGINHEQTVPDLQNRPIRLVDEGQPIAELFA
jgi:hypothetical protein